jgi:hypothetical protein
LNQKSTKKKPQRAAIDEKDVVHPPGVEPGPIAWKAIILPLDQECLMKDIAKILIYKDNNSHQIDLNSSNNSTIS